MEVNVLTNGPHLIQTADVLAMSASAAELLKTRMAKQVQHTGEVAGWHARFSPGRIGAPGSAVPLRFFREYGGLDKETEGRVVQAILNAQYNTSDDDGGWHILSVSAMPSVEGTALTIDGLFGASGKGLRDAINRGQSWLEKACSPGGGWGSTPGSPPRVSTTCACLLALTKLPAPDAAVINGAAQWLVNAQRANGSWGPVPGEPGTITHTAMAIQALVAAGLLTDHPALRLAFDYIQRYWDPEPTAVEQESYDFHVGQTYHRVTAVYDVDATVALAVLSINSDGLGTKLWYAVSQWIACNDKGTWWERDDGLLTVWTVVPRALVCLRLARQLGSNTTIRWRDKVVVVSSSPNWGPLFRLCLSAGQPSRTWQRLIVGLTSAAVGISVVTLAALGKLNIQTTVVGVLLPLAIFALQLPRSSGSK
jgi:hypothetical protein